MSSIKKLAHQTFWYGFSSIFARFLNYLLTPYLTYKFSAELYGEMSALYALIPFLNILVTHGMETAFFRFSTQKNKTEIYNTSSVSILIFTIAIALLMYIFKDKILQLLQIQNAHIYIYLCIIIISTDALLTIPFAKIRLDERPIYFAVIKVIGILINIGSVYFFLSYIPHILLKQPTHWLHNWYNPTFKVGYVLLANVLQNGIMFLLLLKYVLNIHFRFNFKLWVEMLLYSTPLIIVGFGGMINETADRIMLGLWAPTNLDISVKAQVGIYSACYKLSLLISISIQAFRMGAEPFFFKKFADANAPKIYAKIMKYFVIILCILFLTVLLFLDIWKYFIYNKSMWVGLKIIPILLLANMFLGIYYNLTIWYKLSNKTMAGVWITLLGCVITLIINYFFIPIYSYMASAWATFFCYGGMMILCYYWGKKVYPIPYLTKKIIAYMVLAVIIYFIHNLFNYIIKIQFLQLFFSVILWVGFILFAYKVEKKELKKISK